MHKYRPNMISPFAHLTKCCVKNLYATTEVPHIHPSHTTYVNNQFYQHKHYFPHTESMVESVSHQHFSCTPVAPGTGAPGQVMGAQTGPGYGAQSPVKGAHQGPGLGNNQPYGR